VCGAGPQAEVSFVGVHKGEEPPVSGDRGCGNIFFHRCSLGCVFCQNWQISAANQVEPSTMSVDELAEEMLRLQDQEVHTLGLVAPTSHLPTLVPALRKARAIGLTIPIVYNSGGYDSVEALKFLDGIVDVYLPDMKYGSDEVARVYSGVVDYVSVSRAAVREMFDQVGELEVDEQGIARKGLIVRHLVLPGGMADTVQVLQWIARSLSKTVHVSLMGQYRPAFQVEAGLFPELNRALSEEEYRFHQAVGREAGLQNLYVQDLSSSDDLNPDFRMARPFD